MTTIVLYKKENREKYIGNMTKLCRLKY